MKVKSVLRPPGCIVCWRNIECISSGRLSRRRTPAYCVTALVRVQPSPSVLLSFQDWAGIYCTLLHNFLPSIDPLHVFGRNIASLTNYVFFHQLKWFFRQWFTDSVDYAPLSWISPIHINFQCKRSPSLIPRMVTFISYSVCISFWYCFSLSDLSYVILSFFKGQTAFKSWCGHSTSPGCSTFVQTLRILPM